MRTLQFKCENAQFYRMTKNDIKYLKSLQQKKYRDQYGRFVIEGSKMIRELLDSDIPYERIFYTEEAPDFLKKEGFLQIKKAEMERISGLKTASNCLAEVPFLAKKEVNFPQGEIYVGLDKLQDPGNLGTIIRICDWYGIKKIICSRDTVELYNPKVVQSSMGGIFRVEVHYLDLFEYCNSLNINDINFLAAVIDGKEPREIIAPVEGLLLIGNESKGISKELLHLSSERVAIKRQGKAESLNASVACGILVNWLKS